MMKLTERELAAIKNNVDAPNIKSGQHHILKAHDMGAMFEPHKTGEQWLDFSMKAAIEGMSDNAIISGLILCELEGSKGEKRMASRTFCSFASPNADLPMTENMAQLRGLVQDSITVSYGMGHKVAQTMAMTGGAFIHFIGAIGIVSVYDTTNGVTLAQTGWRLSSTKDDPNCVVCRSSEYDWEECEAPYIAKYLVGYDELGNVLGMDQEEREQSIRRVLATMERTLN